jgi:Spy/CpxP family protein refolding chaperone
MAEVGLVRSAQVALDVAQTTVPRYRTTFSTPEQQEKFKTLKEEAKEKRQGKEEMKQ